LTRLPILLVVAEFLVVLAKGYVELFQSGGGADHESKLLFPGFGVLLYGSGEHQLVLPGCFVPFFDKVLGVFGFRKNFSNKPILFKFFL